MGLLTVGEGIISDSSCPWGPFLPTGCRIQPLHEGLYLSLLYLFMSNLVDFTGRPEFFRRETEEQCIWGRGEGEGFRKNEGRVGCHPHIVYERIIKNKKKQEKKKG